MMNDDVLSTQDHSLSQFFLLCFVFGEAVIFKVYDIDDKGKITFKDLLEVLRDLTGSFMSEEQREVLIYYFINFCISSGRFPFFVSRKIFGFVA